MNKSVNIVKFSGEIEAFNIDKLMNSLRKSKSSEEIVVQIAEAVQSSIRDGMTTKQIYEMAYKMLKKKSKSGSARYKLKKAIMELGPTGYPFERYVGKILEYEGFKSVEVGVVMQGHCVTHEVDVSALKGNEHFLIECKFHSDQGRFCNVKIPLYVHSRFKDLERQWLKQKEHSAKRHKGWVYTNTRLTSDALQFGECAGLGLVSWDYPPNNSLKKRIDSSGLHPLTCLTSLTKKEKQNLLNMGIVLCKEICDKPAILESVGITELKKKEILIEARELCNN